MLNPLGSIITTSLSRTKGVSMIPAESWNMRTTGPKELKTDYMKLKLK
jgi:hypothetical protein